jgi:hypothetical protein
MVTKHPLGQDAAASAHNPREASLHQGHVLDRQASVDGLVIHSLLAVLFNDVPEVIGIELLNRGVHAF